jgi:hypothetical protein
VTLCCRTSLDWVPLPLPRSLTRGGIARPTSSDPHGREEERKPSLPHVSIWHIQEPQLQTRAPAPGRRQRNPLSWPSQPRSGPRKFLDLARTPSLGLEHWHEAVAAGHLHLRHLPCSSSRPLHQIMLPACQPPLLRAKASLQYVSSTVRPPHRRALIYPTFRGRRHKCI